MSDLLLVYYTTIQTLCQWDMYLIYLGKLESRPMMSVK